MIVDELAFAELHIGVIAFRVDVFKVHKCYKGAIRYDMNFLKVIFHSILCSFPFIIDFAFPGFCSFNLFYLLDYYLYQYQVDIPTVTDFVMIWTSLLS